MELNELIDVLEKYTKMYENCPRDDLKDNVSAILKQRKIKAPLQWTAKILNKKYETVASYRKMDGNHYSLLDILKLSRELEEPLENFFIKH